MTPDALIRVGAAIWGAHWQTRMAEALAINPRTIRYWMSGRKIIPPGIALDLDGAIIAEMTRLEQCRTVLRLGMPHSQPIDH